MGSTASCPMVEDIGDKEEAASESGSDGVLMLESILQYSKTEEDDDDIVLAREDESHPIRRRTPCYESHQKCQEEDEISIVFFEEEDNDANFSDDDGCAFDKFQCFALPSLDSIFGTAKANAIFLPNERESSTIDGELELKVSRDVSDYEDQEEDPDTDLDSLRLELIEAEADYRKREATTLLETSATKSTKVITTPESGNSRNSSFIDLQQLLFSDRDNTIGDDDTKASSASGTSLLLFTSTEKCKVVDIYETRTTLLKPSHQDERSMVSLEQSGIPFRKCRDPKCSCHQHATFYHTVKGSSKETRSHFGHKSPEDSSGSPSSFHSRRLERKRISRQLQQQEHRNQTSVADKIDDDETLTTADFSNSTRSAMSGYSGSSITEQRVRQQHRARSEDYVVESSHKNNLVFPTLERAMKYFPSKKPSSTHETRIQDCNDSAARPSSPPRIRSRSTPTTISPPPSNHAIACKDEGELHPLSPTCVMEDVVPYSSLLPTKRRNPHPFSSLEEREVELEDCRRTVKHLQKTEKRLRRMEYKDLSMASNPEKEVLLQRKNRFHRAMKLAKVYHKMGLLHYQQGRYDTGRYVLDQGLDVLIADRANAATHHRADSFEHDYIHAPTHHSLPPLPTLDEVAPYFSKQALELASQLVLAQGKLFAAQGLWHRAKHSSGTVLQWSAFQKQRMILSLQEPSYYNFQKDIRQKEYWKEWGPMTSRALVLFGEAFDRELRPEIAIRYYHEALEVERHYSQEPFHVHTAETLYKIGNLHASQGALGLAEDCYQRSLSIYRYFHQSNRFIGDSFSDCLLADEATVLASLGWVYSLQNKASQAAESTAQALEWTVRILGPSHKNVASLQHQMDCIRQNSGAF